LVTARRLDSRSFFFTCALRRFIFIELRRSNLPIFVAPSGERASQERAAASFAEKEAHLAESGRG
jgi:hypothetical protein